ncbi:MAG: DUF3301 domain-containing protein [Pseudomonadales bacterium]|nr:DUF3301 domain-containing protein [Pseudomonadales bacterium]
MLSLSLIFWSTVVIAFVAFWWQSDKIKLFAINHITHYCRARNLQLLDQTMVLKGLWPVRSKEGSLQLRRRYQFEFTSTGEIRNKGIIEMMGRRINGLQLEAHIMPGEQDELQ